MNPIVVAGVSGHTGRVAAETLLAQKQPVRVVVRNENQGRPWKDKGAEVAVADLGDAKAVQRALGGASAAYLLAPPKLDAADVFADRKLLIDALASAVRGSRVPHVVLLSSIGAQLPSGTGPIVMLRYAEQVLADAAPSAAFVRPCYFMDNWAGVVPMVRDGVLPVFLPAALAFPQIATHDIGVVAAREVLAPAKGARIVELCGPTASANDVAAAFAKLIGRQVGVQVAPNAAVVPAFTSMGVGRSMAAMFAEMYATMEAGKLVFEKPARVERTPTSLLDGLRPLLA